MGEEYPLDIILFKGVIWRFMNGLNTLIINAMLRIHCE